MVGLGRMGANLVRRVTKAGHECVVFDVNPDAVGALAKEGQRSVLPRRPGVKADGPRAVWVMVPAGDITAQTVSEWLVTWRATTPSSTVAIRNYRDDISRAAAVRDRGIHYIDVGNQRWVWGLERGYCLMIGGEDEPVERLDPIFAAIRAGCRCRRADPRTNREAQPSRGGVPALRPYRSRTLREDGPQRDRVRRHGRLRRGTQHLEACQRRRHQAHR